MKIMRVVAGQGRNVTGIFEPVIEFATGCVEAQRIVRLRKK